MAWTLGQINRDNLPTGDNEQHVLKGVIPKSPVREIRTPGSVRGLVGDGQSYRDFLTFPESSSSLSVIAS
jgi:hypothetical protein